MCRDINLFEYFRNFCFGNFLWSSFWRLYNMYGSLLSQIMTLVMNPSLSLIVLSKWNVIISHIHKRKSLWVPDFICLLQSKKHHKCHVLSAQTVQITYCCKRTITVVHYCSIKIKIVISILLGKLLLHWQLLWVSCDCSSISTKKNQYHNFDLYWTVVYNHEDQTVLYDKKFSL